MDNNQQPPLTPPRDWESYNKLVMSGSKRPRIETSTSLIDAIRTDNPEEVFNAINLYTHGWQCTNECDRDNNTPLSIAVSRANTHYESNDLVALSNQHSIIEELLNHGADINMHSSLSESTPLGLAIIHNNPVTTQLLLSYGASVFTTNRGGENALLSYSTIANDPVNPPCPEILDNIINTIRAYGGNITSYITTEDNFGRNALHNAIETGNTYLTETLLRLDTEKSLINRTTRSGKTPLHIAYENGSSNVVPLLLVNGADATAEIHHFIEGQDVGSITEQKANSDNQKRIQKDITVYTGTAPITPLLQSCKPLLETRKDGISESDIQVKTETGIDSIHHNSKTAVTRKQYHTAVAESTVRDKDRETLLNQILLPKTANNYDVFGEILSYLTPIAFTEVPDSIKHYNERFCQDLVQQDAHGVAARSSGQLFR